MYEGNEEKLTRIVQGELESGKYLYKQELMNFLNCPSFNVPSCFRTHIFAMNLAQLATSFTELGLRKRMMQVNIVQESMVKREQMMREGLSHEKYTRIFKGMRIPMFGQHNTIYDQYHETRKSELTNSQSIDLQEQLFWKINSAENAIFSLFKGNAEKNRDKSVD